MVSCDFWQWSAVTESSTCVYGHYIRKQSNTFSSEFQSQVDTTHDLSAKGKTSQKNVWFAQERAISCWQLKERSWLLNPNHRLSWGSVLRPTCPKFYQLWLFGHSPPPPLLSCLVWAGSMCCKNWQRKPYIWDWETGGGKASAWKMEVSRLDQLACLGLAWLQHGEVGGGGGGEEGGKMKMYSWDGTRARNT